VFDLNLNEEKELNGVVEMVRIRDDMIWLVCHWWVFGVNLGQF